MERTQIDTVDSLTLEAARHPASDAEHGTVLLAHGITQDMDEGGMFVRLADRLSDAGFNVVRFSFRGHGTSDGAEVGVTIGGELLDFQAAFEETMAAFDGPYFVVAKSFGAVSTSYSLEHYESEIEGLALWNPVLDIEGTFLDPSVSWGVENFTGDQLDELRETGVLTIDGEFRIGRVLYEELHHYDPGARFQDSPIPALVIHGDGDDIVPYEDARRVAMGKGADFYTIENADHGFRRPGAAPEPDAERPHDDRTVEWLLERVES